MRAIAVLQGIAAQIETEAETVKTETTRLGALVNQTNDRPGAADPGGHRAAGRRGAALGADRGGKIRGNGSGRHRSTGRHRQPRRAAHARPHRRQRSGGGQAGGHAARGRRAPHGTASDAGAPVAGHVLQAYGAATAAGPAQGISYGAAPGARVTAPCAGTVLFAGAFPSYGHVVIAGCGAGTNIVLAGMARLDVATGEHVADGQPVGEMQGYDPAAPTRQPILYVELRRNGTPVDPSLWLAHGHF